MALLLFVPVLHQGYLELFSRHQKEDSLYIIGEKLVSEFPQLSREIRRIKPEQIAQAIKALGLFKKIEVVEAEDLPKISDLIVSADEVEIRSLIAKYLPKAEVVYDISFLRWDAKNVQSVTEVSADRKISKSKFDREMIGHADGESSKSSDWFRQVGAVLIKDGDIVLRAYNERQPTPHAPYSEGDPRNFVEIGSDTHLRTTVHAEQMIIAKAAKEGISLEGSTIYVNVFPCPDCAQLIAHSGIRKCCYSSGYATLDGERVLKIFDVELVLVK